MDIIHKLNLKLGYVSGRPVIREMTSSEKKWLLNLVTHRQSRWRWSAANEIGKQNIKEGVDLLIPALKDIHWLVRLHAAKALGKIGNEKAVAPLKESLNDNCLYVRRHVIVALGKIGDKSIIPFLLRVVQADKKMWGYVEEALSNFIDRRVTYYFIRAAFENNKIEDHPDLADYEVI